MMGLEFWRDLAVVWLSLLCLVTLIVPVVALYFAVRGMGYVNEAVPKLLHKAQGYTQMAKTQTNQMSDKVAQPIVQARAKASRIEATIRSLFS
ncbi:MAG: hypothetical protein R2911_03695 [Caldilineaceae bacterium]